MQMGIPKFRKLENVKNLEIFQEFLVDICKVYDAYHMIFVVG